MEAWLPIVGQILDLFITLLGKEETRKQLSEAEVRAANDQADLLELAKFGRTSVP